MGKITTKKCSKLPWFEIPNEVPVFRHRRLVVPCGFYNRVTVVSFIRVITAMEFDSIVGKNSFYIPLNCLERKNLNHPGTPCIL